MKPRFYEVLEMAIEMGIHSGFLTFYKHRDDSLDIDTIRDLEAAIEQAVMSNLHEWFEMPARDADP